MGNLVVFNSLGIAAASAFIVVTISIVMACFTRGRGGLTYAVRFLTMGYAIPSTITAVGIVILLGEVSQFISGSQMGGSDNLANP